MLTKEGHVQYWMAQADDDWEATEILFSSKKYLQSLFWGHLVLEKICKALWILNHESNSPPKIHNLIYLIGQTPLAPPDELMEIMIEANRFQLEGRYPEYRKELYQQTNQANSRALLDRYNTLRLWLKQQLP